MAEGGAELGVPGVGEVPHEDGGEVGVVGGGVAAAAAAIVASSSIHLVTSSIAPGAAAASAKAPELAAAASPGPAAEAATTAKAAAVAPSLLRAPSSHHHLAALLGRRGRDADRPVAERVALHARQRRVALSAVAEAHEAVAARAARRRVGDDFRGSDRGEERAEGLLESEVCDLRGEVADEDGVVG